MSLITWGYGHLTIITMGLGHSFRVAAPEPRRQAGEVSFQDVTPKVKITDELVRTSFEEKKKVIEMAEKAKKDVIFDDGEYEVKDGKI